MQPPDGTDASGYARVRVSDADRERAIDILKAAFAEGRLTREEHAERVERAIASRTGAELAAVSSDLPTGPLGALPSQARRDLTRSVPRPAGRTNPLAIASLVCGLIPVLPATLAAIALAVAARHQIRQTGERGAGLAVAGLALGALYILLTVVLVFVVVRLTPTGIGSSVRPSWRRTPAEARRRTSLQQLPGHHHALDLVGALVDLGDLRVAGAAGLGHV